MPARILVVDDESIVAADLENRLLRLGYDVPAVVSTGEEAVRAAANIHPDLVLMDIQLAGGMDGVTAAAEIYRTCHIPSVFVTAYADDLTVQKAKRAQPSGYLLKPFNERELHSVIEIGLYKHTMEERLRESEHKLGIILGSVADGVVVTDVNDVILFMNPVAERLFGCPFGTAKEKEITSFVHFRDSIGEDPGKVSRRVSEGVVRNRDGEEIAVECKVAALQEDGSEQRGNVWVIRDISERKKAEAELRRLSRAVEQSPSMVMITDMEGIILYVNPRFVEVTGYSREEACGSPARILKSGRTPAGVYNALWHTIMKGMQWRGELQNRKKGGAVFHASVSVSPITDEQGRMSHFVVDMEDTTEEKLLQEHIQKAQRLESLGVLAGGIAHDLNNVLTPMLLALRLLKKRNPDPEAMQILSTIEESGKRGSEIIRQVLSFARGFEGKQVLLQAKHIIREIGNLIGETFPKAIDISTDYPRDLWPIRADATQLHQILMNLCVNARDAMPHGGKLIVRAYNFNADESFRAAHPDMCPGPHVALEVTDTGTGIEPEIMDRIFSPFFTTKEEGKGTGLGLSTVQTMVKGHKGIVTVDSKIGEGTTFHVYLPAVVVRSAEQSELVEDEEPVGGSTILVVDDERAVRMIMQMTLESGGYHVITAGNGKEALAYYKEKKESIDLIIADIMMPVMDGRELITSVRKENPGMKVIAISGLLDVDAMEPVRKEVNAVVTKPFTASEFLRVVGETLAC